MFGKRFDNNVIESAMYGEIPKEEHSSVRTYDKRSEKPSKGVFGSGRKARKPPVRPKKKESLFSWLFKPKFKKSGGMDYI